MHTGTERNPRVRISPIRLAVSSSKIPAKQGIFLHPPGSRPLSLRREVQTRVRGVWHTGSRLIQVRNCVHSSSQKKPGERSSGFLRFGLYFPAFLRFPASCDRLGFKSDLSGSECKRMGYVRYPCVTPSNSLDLGETFYRRVNSFSKFPPPHFPPIQ